MMCICTVRFFVLFFCAVCMVGRLKDQRVDVKERLKLACKLWLTQDDVGPNKHQVIVDTVVTILINNRKRFDDILLITLLL